MENLKLIYRSLDWCICLYRLNAGSLTSNRFSKYAYKVAFKRHRRAWLAFPASQGCDTGRLKVKFHNLILSNFSCIRIIFLTVHCFVVPTHVAFLHLLTNETLHLLTNETLHLLTNETLNFIAGLSDKI